MAKPKLVLAFSIKQHNYHGDKTTCLKTCVCRVAAVEIYFVLVALEKSIAATFEASVQFAGEGKRLLRKFLEACCNVPN